LPWPPCPALFVTAPDFFFFWSQLHLRKWHLGKLHKERIVTGRIFQALATQTDTNTIAFIYKILTLYV
jgi:hypothetical protein